MVEVNLDNKSSFATIGGDVLLTFPDGTKTQYGLTARHVFSPAEGDGIETSESDARSNESDFNDWSDDDDQSQDRAISCLPPLMFGSQVQSDRLINVDAAHEDSTHSIFSSDNLPLQRFAHS